jgi:hypothetical protein
MHYSTWRLYFHKATRTYWPFLWNGGGLFLCKWWAQTLIPLSSSYTYSATIPSTTQCEGQFDYTRWQWSRKWTNCKPSVQPENSR